MSPRIGRRAEVPPAVRERAGLGRGDRLLAAAATTDGTWLLGSRDALVIVEPADTVRVAWERVETADWEREQQRLRLVETGEFGEVRPVHVFTVPDPGRLLPMIRERVTASVLLQRRVTVQGRRGFTVVARRPPGGPGDLMWTCRFDDGVDPADPAVQAVAERALREARADLGHLDGPLDPS